MKTTHKIVGKQDFHEDFLYKALYFLLIIQNIVHVKF